MFNCNGGEDEATCPTYSTFNDCNDNLNACHWNEDFPDHVDFVAIGGSLFFVVDFDQEMSALHTISWSKSSFSKF